MLLIDPTLTNCSAQLQNSRRRQLVKFSILAYHRELIQIIFHLIWPMQAWKREITKGSQNLHITTHQV